MAADDARAIGFIALKDRSPSPVARLFARSALPVVEDFQTQRTLCSAFK
jgi:hypothetical protein